MGARSGSPSRTLLTSQLDRRLQERRLADRLDRLEGRTGRGQGARVRLRVGELEHEGDVDALDVGEAGVPEERLAGTGPAERHHGRLVLDLGGRGQRERRQRPRARVTP